MTPEQAQRVEELRTTLVAIAGGYLRSTARELRATCERCTAPVAGYRLCLQCNAHESSGMPIARRVATLVYAEKSTQAYTAMYGYKRPRPVAEHEQIVQSLLTVGLLAHVGCLNRLAGQMPLVWATVPSTRLPGIQHPLNRLATGVFRSGFEAHVATAQGAVKGREPKSGNFVVLDDVSGKHVLILDDSWVSGGSAQSLAIDMSEAGAATTSIMAVARVLNRGWEPTDAFLATRMQTLTYAPLTCPWTEGICP